MFPAHRGVPITMKEREQETHVPMVVSHSTSPQTLVHLTGIPDSSRVKPPRPTPRMPTEEHNAWVSPQQGTSVVHSLHHIIMEQVLHVLPDSPTCISLGPAGAP